jgi:hypothetical protein
MTQKFTYKIVLKVQHEGLLTVPVADFHVEGTLDPARDFAGQIAETHARYLARIRPRLERARKS